MRTEDAIYYAHDMLVTAVNGDVDGLVMNDTTKMRLKTALDALCWVLEHDHNTAFQENLDSLEATIARLGGSFERIQ